jgi:hypothetical protein
VNVRLPPGHYLQAAFFSFLFFLVVLVFELARQVFYHWSYLAGPFYVGNF